MSMHRQSRNGRKATLIVAAVVGVLTIVFAGGATADRLIGSPQIKNGGVYSPDLHDGAVRMPDLSAGVKDHLAGGCGSGAGVDFAINSGGEWKVIGNAFNQSAGTITVDDTRRAGVMHLATYPNGAYADAGVIVELGTVGSRFDATTGAFELPTFKGPYVDQLAVNLYVDVAPNGQYFSFDHNGVFQGLAGDEVLYSVDESTNRADIAGAVDDDTVLWAWVGVSGNHDQTAALTRFAGHDLAIC